MAESIQSVVSPDITHTPLSKLLLLFRDIIKVIFFALYSSIFLSFSPSMVLSSCEEGQFH